MPERPRFVVDASVAVKWHLDDEGQAEQALALLAEYREGRVDLTAPDQIRYEVANAIRVATRTRRLGFREGRTAIGLFLSWGIPTASADDLILAAYDLAEQLSCSLYDVLYVALAQAANCPLIYADRALRRLLEGRFPLALWIGDYAPPTAPAR